MDGPSGLNQPRRKSRLRSRENAYTRRPAVPTSETTESTEPAEPATEPAEAPVYDPGLETEPEPARTAATVEDLTEAPPHEPAPADQEPAAGAGEDEDKDELPEAFRLNRVYSAAPARNPLTDWRWVLGLVALLGAALAGGYEIGRRVAPPQGVSPRTLYSQGVRSVLGPLSPELQAEVDNAFEATKHGRYDEARRRFAALHDKHPEWPSMAVEGARDSLYQSNFQAAQSVLGVLSANRLTPDADFMLALLHLTNKEFDAAETSFALACALDPARADFYYFWGECLRRDGKPQEAMEKFRAALLRNQYENAEGLYQLKLWLSEIQADKEESSGAGREIDGALGQPRPPYEALFAAAGRAIKVGRFSDAADFMRKAQEITEPSVFRVILQDPMFLEESTRPQLAEFYR